MAKVKKGQSVKVEPLVSKKSIFYPMPPNNLPSLHQGYIFAPERMLEGERRGTTSKSVGRVDVESVLYRGSFITKSSSKALLSYPAQRQAKRSRTPGVTVKIMVNVWVNIGESIGGYLVKEIRPEKIVFSRDSERIEKYLYEPGRVQATSRSVPPFVNGRTLPGKVVPRAPVKQIVPQVERHPGAAPMVPVPPSPP